MWEFFSQVPLREETDSPCSGGEGFGVFGFEFGEGLLPQVCYSWVFWGWLVTDDKDLADFIPTREEAGEFWEG